MSLRQNLIVQYYFRKIFWLLCPSAMPFSFNKMAPSLIVICVPISFKFYTFVITPADSGDLLHRYLGRSRRGWVGMDLLHEEKKSAVGAGMA